MMKQLPLLPLLLLFSPLTGNSSACTNAVSKVISTEGTDVILPCSPSTRENLQNKLFDWKKVGQGGETQHEVFMYDSAVHYGGIKVGQSEQFKGRVSHFQNELKHGNASIVIRKTKVIDSGSYTCFFPRLQPIQEFCIELVVDPILTVRTIPGASPKPSVTILDQTKDWSLLQCEVHGAYPKPKVEWRKSSGNILPAEEPQVSKTGDRYSVTLNTTVTKTDRYQCVATQEEIYHQTKPAHIYVLLHGAASEPYVTSLDQTKDWSLLQCLVRGAFPKPKVEWQDSSGEVLPAAEPQVSERGGSFYITLNATVTKTDRYQCVVTQEEINHQTRAEISVYISGEEPERSSGSGSPWIGHGITALCTLVVVVVVVAAGFVIKRKCKGDEQSHENDSFPSDEMKSLRSSVTN